MKCTKPQGDHFSPVSAGSRFLGRLPCRHLLLLMNAAMDFCRSSGYERVYLWTFEGLFAARRLYEKAGFELVEERNGRQWGTEVNEQKFELSM